MNQEWIPKHGDLVRHIPSRVIFLVQARSRISTDGQPDLYTLKDHKKGEKGKSFPLLDCEPLERVEDCQGHERLSMQGREVTVKTVQNGDGSFTCVLSDGEKKAALHVPSAVSRAQAAAEEIAKEFGGSIVDETVEQPCNKQWQDEYLEDADQ
jgi:hypothetical protein